MLSIYSILSAGVWRQSRSLSFEGDSDSEPYLPHLDFCVILLQSFLLFTFVQFILQLKLCLYTTVDLLLEEFKYFSQVILKYTIIMSHNKPGVGVESDFGPRVAVQVL